MLPVFIVTLLHFVTNKRIRVLSLHNPLYAVVVLSTVYTLFDILGTKEKGPVSSSTLYLFTCTSVQPFINH